MSNLVPLGGFGHRPRKDYRCPASDCDQTTSALGALIPDCPIHHIPMRKANRRS